MKPQRTIDDLSFTEKVDAIDDMKKLEGLPPYDGGGNICRHDNYFGMFLERKYGMPTTELRKLLR